MRRRRTRVAVALVALLASLLALGMSPGRFTGGPEEGLRTAAGYRSPEATAAGPTLDQLTWLGQGTVPGAGTRWEDMSRWALLDLKAFQAPTGAVAAGPGGPWGYFWPRDGSFAAVAFAVSGHTSEAAQVLDRLGRLELEPGVGFQARYALDGTPLTDRAPQSDGCGWVLWAIGRVRESNPGAVPPNANELRERCVGTLTRLVDGGRRLPPPSPDYWELPVDETSLGTVAPMVAGLHMAARDYATTGDPAASSGVGRTAQRLADTVARDLGPQFQRFGDHGGHDAAVSMLLPPFLEPRDLSAPVARRLDAALRDYQREALQPAGGVAPGTDWVKRDGASWTPQTALLTLTAAGRGQRSTAANGLDWLGAHRTAYGSLPEKVTRSGRPAGPAPLSWTAALVLLTLDELDQQTRG